VKKKAIKVEDHRRLQEICFYTRNCARMELSPKTPQSRTQPTNK